MPEGDTIHRLARRLAPLWVDGRVERLWLRERGEVATLRGARVREVSALGKHLLVGIAGAREEWVLHTHLGMPGRWHPAGGGAPWRQREVPAVELALRGDASPWRCTQPAICELLERRALRLHPVLRRLGPDLLAPPTDLEVVLRRARRSRAALAAELLLDQRVACGLGNVYKNELLFLHEIHPRTPVADLADEEVAALFRHGAELLGANLGPGRRRTRGLDDPTRGGPRFWVYDRGGRPCLRCGEEIRVERVGDAARVTYWCPRCQPARGARGAGRTLAVAAAEGHSFQTRRAGRRVGGPR